MVVDDGSEGGVQGGGSAEDVDLGAHLGTHAPLVLVHARHRHRGVGVVRVDHLPRGCNIDTIQCHGETDNTALRRNSYI